MFLTSGVTLCVLWHRVHRKVHPKVRHAVQQQEHGQGQYADADHQKVVQDNDLPENQAELDPVDE